ncbi:MAG: quinone oxidoreductase [Rhodospirillaceae bacterium TMED8]|nr:quinone oxidoreductase [Magnetovibrio sp.]OUT50379.1 MAG: quinone oxidoreductase [Rhodospirillaceae bacterium TMED8]
MAKAVRIHQIGGPEVLQWEETEIGKPSPEEARIKQTAIGLNYIDVYHRTGLYPIGDLPTSLGTEAAGVVEEVGEKVTNVAVGDRVAYAPVIGAYAESRLILADKLVKLPDSINDQTGAAMMLKGMTASYLIRKTYAVQAGDPVLIMAAAGGVGQILSQWAKHLGATVIGCVGSEEKAIIARSAGCDYTILYNTEDVATRVKEITGGEGAVVSYDSVGEATFLASLDSLRPFGYMVSYGNASGPVEALKVADLASRGSLFFTRPSLMPHTATRPQLDDLSQSLISLVASKTITITINQRYDLENIRQAHEDLEARRTSGSTVLIT